MIAQGPAVAYRRELTLGLRHDQAHAHLPTRAAVSNWTQ